MRREQSTGVDAGRPATHVQVRAVAGRLRHGRPRAVRVALRARRRVRCVLRLQVSRGLRVGPGLVLLRHARRVAGLGRRRRAAGHTARGPAGGARARSAAAARGCPHAEAIAARGRDLFAHAAVHGRGCASQLGLRPAGKLGWHDRGGAVRACGLRSDSSGARATLRAARSSLGPRAPRPAALAAELGVCSACAAPLVPAVRSVEWPAVAVARAQPAAAPTCMRAAQRRATLRWAGRRARCNLAGVAHRGRCAARLRDLSRPAGPAVETAVVCACHGPAVQAPLPSRLPRRRARHGALVLAHGAGRLALRRAAKALRVRRVLMRHGWAMALRRPDGADLAGHRLGAQGGAGLYQLSFRNVGRGPGQACLQLRARRRGGHVRRHMGAQQVGQGQHYGHVQLQRRAARHGGQQQGQAGARGGRPRRRAAGRASNASGRRCREGLRRVELGCVRGVRGTQPSRIGGKWRQARAMHAEDSVWQRLPAGSAACDCWGVPLQGARDLARWAALLDPGSACCRRVSDLRSGAVRLAAGNGSLAAAQRRASL